MTQADRATAIEDAAYKVLAEKGFKGASMLAIAKAAKASNETLYNWYGDKVGLITAMIQRNAAQVESELQAARADGATPSEALHRVSQALLTMVTGDRAVALNRAAAGDITGALGAALNEGGRSRVAPIIGALINDGFGPSDTAQERAETYIALLIGDLQIRRATGAIPPLTTDQITARTNRAMAQFRKLYEG